MAMVDGGWLYTTYGNLNTLNLCAVANVAYFCHLSYDNIIQVDEGCQATVSSN